MDELFIFEKLAQALSDTSLTQLVDDLGFLVGVSMGSLFIIIAGSFLISEAFSAFSGKMHLPFGRVLAGALVVIVAFLAAAALRSAIAESVGIWGQLIAMVILLIGLLGFGTWLTMQLDLGKSLLLAPLFAICLAVPVLLFNFVVWPGSESRVAAARLNLETLDLARYGIEDIEALGIEKEAVNAVDQLEARMLEATSQVAPSQLAMAVRKQEMQEAYEEILLWSERVADGTEQQRRDYRQMLRRYEEARKALTQEQRAKPSGT